MKCFGSVGEEAWNDWKCSRRCRGGCGKRLLTGSSSQASIKASYGFANAVISTPERSSKLFRESAEGGKVKDIFGYD